MPSLFFAIGGVIGWFVIVPLLGAENFLLKLLVMGLCGAVGEILGYGFFRK